jgi:hypothetical protein
LNPRHLKSPAGFYHHFPHWKCYLLSILGQVVFSDKPISYIIFFGIQWGSMIYR